MIATRTTDSMAPGAVVARERPVHTGQFTPVTAVDFTLSGLWLRRGNSDGTITNVNAGLCLDAYGAGTANGTQTVLWSCGGQANQKWTLN
jgi:Ricin-type beta-trefoil lectin domain-like